MASVPPPPPGAPQPPSPGVPPLYTPAPPPAKKTSPWVWVAVGCGGIALLILVILIAGTLLVGKKVADFARGESNPAIAAAKVVAAFDPNIEVVDTDEDAGTITLRNKKTGEEITMDADDVKQGRIRFRNEKGEDVTFEAQGEGEEGTLRIESSKGSYSLRAGRDAELPAWVPVYPDGRTTGSVAGTGGEGDTGMVTFETSDDASTVLAHFEQALKREGFDVNRSSWEQDGTLAGGVVQGRRGGRQVTVTVGAGDGATTASVAYEDR